MTRQFVLQICGRGRLFYDHRSMHVFALLLSRQLRQPVLDLTGLSGFLRLPPRMGTRRSSGRGSAAPTADAAPLPGIYQAVEEQLGLRLESKKTPIEVIVVDRADRVPTAN